MSNLLKVMQIHGVMPSQRKNVVMSGDMTIERALMLLAENKITSAPVILDGEWLGFVDMSDLVAFVLTVYSQAKEVEIGGTKVNWLAWCTDVATVSKRGDLLDRKHLKDIVDRSRMDPWCPVTAFAPLSQLVEVFARRVHRAPVMEGEGHTATLTSIITQSDVLAFLARNIEMLGEALQNKRIEELDIGLKAVHFIQSDAATINGLFQMYSHKIPAVAVVDARTGALVGNLSATDLRGITQADFGDLILEVTDFLRKRSPRSLVPIKCKRCDTIEYVMLKLAATRVHRVWVVDAYMRPTGVVTLTDVMQLLEQSERQP